MPAIYQESPAVTPLFYAVGRFCPTVLQYSNTAVITRLLSPSFTRLSSFAVPVSYPYHHRYRLLQQPHSYLHLDTTVAAVNNFFTAKLALASYLPPDIPFSFPRVRASMRINRRTQSLYDMCKPI